MTTKPLRIVVLLALLILGSWLLTRTSATTPEGMARQEALQRLSPDQRPFNPTTDAKQQPTAARAVRGTAVSPTTVNITNVPSRPSPRDRQKEQYLSGQIDLTENERPVNESIFQQMVNDSLAQKPDPIIQNYQTPNQPALATLNVNTSFKSIDYTQSQAGVPPDADIMVGKDHIIVGVNTSFQIFDKTGNSLFGPILYKDFWANEGGTCATGESDVVMFDPYSAYDEAAGRYILGITAYDQSLNGGDNGWACIAVSASDSATGNWYLYNIDGNAGSGSDYFYDYPHLGVGQDAIYLSANMFGNSFVRSHLHVLDKNAMYAGDPLNFWQINDTSGDFTLQPAKLKGFQTGGWPTNDAEPHYYAATVWGGSSIRIKQVVLDPNDPWGTAPSYSTAGTVSVNSYSQPISQQQSGGSSLEGNDYRLLDLEYWGGKLWATHTIGCNPGSGTVNCIRWYEIDISSGTPSLLQQGTFASNGMWRSFPDLAVDKCGNMVVGYTNSNGSIFPSVSIAGREAGDTAGELKQETLVHAGEATYTAYDSAPHRWGDYSGMALDPDGVTHWYVGQYSRSQATARWSTWVSGSQWSTCTATPEFTIELAPSTTAVCTPNDATFTVNLTSLQGFADSVTLATTGNPGSASFSPTTLTPSGSSTLTISGAAPGEHTFTVSASGGNPSLERTAEATLTAFDAAPAAPTLTSPTDGETAVSVTTTLTWQDVGSISYDLQIATDAEFSNIVVDQTTLTSNSYAATLAANTVHYWRLRAANPCGSSSWTAVSAFQTTPTDSCTEALLEPGFEAGPGSAWNASSSFNLTPINGSNPRSGNYAAQLGQDRDNETSQVWQTAVIDPNATSATLSYWYHIDSSDICGSYYDEGLVQINSSTLSGHRYDLCSGSSTSSFVQATADLSSHIGSTPEIRFIADNDYLYASTFTIDDVALTVCTATAVAAADYSDLPASYGIAWHTGGGSLKLGTAWDSDVSFATGHDDATDDGLTFPASLAAGENAAVTVTVQGGSGWLQGWIDWNNDGDFDDTGELVTDQAVSSGNNALSLPVATTAVKSIPLNYRFRLANSSPGSSSGSSSSGEVTDGQTPAVAAPCATPTAVNDLSASHSSSQIALDWSNTNADDYEVRRSAGDFYFANSAGTLITTTTAATYSDNTAALNDPNTHHVYQIRAVNGCGSSSNSTHTVAEFEFALTPGE